jgi:oxazoline/thiazoline dehydrogenase
MGTERILAISKYVHVEWRRGEVLLRSLLSEAGIASDDAGVLLVLHAFALPKSIDETVRELDGWIEPSAVRALIDELTAAAILVEGADDGSWEVPDLVFHQHTTSITAPAKREGPNPTSPIRPAGLGALALPRVDPANRASSPPLWTSLRERRSVRDFGSAPVTRTTLAELLERACADQGPPRAGVVRRPYPSGGALHSLEVYPVLAERAVDEIPAGIYRYSAADHALASVAHERETRAILEDARAMMGASVAPPVVFIVSSRFDRVTGDYRTVAYRLVLIELGGLLQTLQLTADALQLGGCVLGAVPCASQLPRVLGTDPVFEPLLGAIAIGPAGSAREAETPER